MGAMPIDRSSRYKSKPCKMHQAKWLWDRTIGPCRQVLHRET